MQYILKAKGKNVGRHRVKINAKNGHSGDIPKAQNEPTQSEV